MKPWYQDDLFWLAVALAVGAFAVPASILLARDILRNYWRDRRWARRQARGFQVRPVHHETTESHVAAPGIAIPPPAGNLDLVRTLAIWLGGTALFAWFAIVSYRNGARVSLTVWALAAVWWSLLLPWKNRTLLRALLAGLFTGRRMHRIRRNDGGQTVIRCWKCGGDAVVDQTVGSTHCKACGASGTVRNQRTQDLRTPPG